ncbi:hypothetical protein [Streptomyces rimosus]|uniref:hypothetical protein n=1 Tax=Streptomyces rimosus TaxID=1927 RepID=UPI0006B28391|nr:hypothetical protein [Streptomyces rimosus]KOT55907.1 hypothetical protein ADK45_28140 [Streptomyces rimosus subsp. rimosus]
MNDAIAAGSVLAGAGMTGLIQYMTVVRAARTERAERHRREVGEAAVTLAGALVDFRRHVYLKVTAAREGRDVGEGRLDRWEARSAVSRAVIRVQAMAPEAEELIRVAREAVTTNLALADAASRVADAVRNGVQANGREEVLSDAGVEARRLDGELMAATATYLNGGAR